MLDVIQFVCLNLKLVVPESRYVETEDKPVTAAVTRTYRPRYLAALPIVTMKGSDIVVDLGEMLMSNIARPPSPGRVVYYTGRSGSSVNRALSKYTKIKNFPENTLIDVDLAMGRPGGGGQSVGISYAFRKLPALAGYTPRAADVPSARVR